MQLHKLTVVDNRKPPAEEALPFRARLEQHLGRVPHEVSEDADHFSFLCHNADEAMFLKDKLSQIFGEEATVDIAWPDTGVELKEQKALPPVEDSAPKKKLDAHSSSNIH